MEQILGNLMQQILLQVLALISPTRVSRWYAISKNYCIYRELYDLKNLNKYKKVYFETLGRGGKKIKKLIRRNSIRRHT